MRNEIVFPLPVRAAPSTSLPLRDTGMLDAWISVISTKDRFFSPGKIVNIPGYRVSCNWILADRRMPASLPESGGSCKISDANVA